MKRHLEAQPEAIFISDKTRILEIAGVIVTAIGKIIFMDFLRLRLLFIAVSIIVWTAYIIYRYSRDNQVLKYWGFRSDNTRRVILRLFPFGIAALALCLVTGYLRGSLNLTWHILPILVLYPLWGTIQQFLVIGLVAGNLRDLKRRKINENFIIGLTAILFGLIHYPYYWLVAATFILALLYGFVYLKSKNVFVLGLFHGWLGAVYFYTVVGRDPFVEIFGKFVR
jgi:uncharacterized protein